MPHKSHAKVISFNATNLNGSLSRRRRRRSRKTALIDQRAVAAGKNCDLIGPGCDLTGQKKVI